MNIQIYIINQYVDLSSHAKLAAHGTAEKVVFCCSHKLFPTEMALIEPLFHDRLEVLEFSDLICDADAEACDDQASAKLAPKLCEVAFREHYPGHHMAVSGRLKNEKLHCELRRLFPGGEYHHSDGLGIDGQYWLGQGSQALTPAVHYASPPESSCGARREGAGVEVRVATIVNDSCAYIFIANTDRVRFHADVQLSSHRLTADLEGVLASERPWEIVLQEIEQADIKVQDIRLATTIHGYRSKLLGFNRPLHVIVDGYHPPNYPRTYLDLYDPGVIFEAREPISCEWFRRHGRSCAINSRLLDPVRFRSPEVRWTGRRPVVLFALNHAGDWSALINRSDTDRLVIAAAEAAASLLQVDVIIRPHPTMAHRAHEGWRARERIEAFVENCKLANLAVSGSSLEEDLAHADIVVSEYSQVLLDAIANGIIGITANFTGRRSFLATYSAMGIPAVSSKDELVAALEGIIGEPDNALAAQEVLCACYTNLQTAVTNGCPVCCSEDINWVSRHQDFDECSIHTCHYCGHFFISPEPTDQYLESYYRNVYDPGRKCYLGQWYLQFMIERADAQYRFVAEEMADAYGKEWCADWKIVDIGCGVGALTERFRNVCADVEGYDVDFEVIAFGRKWFPEANIRMGGFHEQVKSPVNLLLMSHVLEHMTDVKSQLKRLVSQVVPGGYLFIEVPNTEHAMSDATPETDAHIHFFTMGSLKRLMNEMGFKIVACRSCGVSFSLRYQAIANGTIDAIYEARHHALRPEGDDTGIWLRCLVRIDNVGS